MRDCGNNHVFELKNNMISMLRHPVCSYIYGIIPYNNRPPEHHYYINFVIQGMYNIEEEVFIEFNNEHIFYTY